MTKTGRTIWPKGVLLTAAGTALITWWCGRGWAASAQQEHDPGGHQGSPSKYEGDDRRDVPKKSGTKQKDTGGKKSDPSDGPDSKERKMN
jgi:hypothetical protein